jgi:hypothetical protein
MRLWTFNEPDKPTILNTAFSVPFFSRKTESVGANWTYSSPMNLLDF